MGYPPAVRYALPQAYEDLDHTADVGVRVRGATAEEALARLALALGTLLAGESSGAVASDGASPGPEPAPGAAAAPRDREERLSVAGGPGLAGSAIALLRELLFRFATERLIPVEVEVHRVADDGAEATVAFARYDPARDGEGVDVKAVTWHAARLEREGDGWVAQAVLDI
jgi:SHS2 domain-containing protein